MNKALEVRNPISHRLMRMNVLVSAVALFFACASFLGYDAWSFRQNLVNSLRTEAEIIGSNSVSALTFNDPDAATTTLSALRSSPHIVSALIVTPDGKVFASYQRGKDSPQIVPRPLERRLATEEWTEANLVLLGSRVVFQGTPVGVVYIASETTAIGQRIRRYIYIAAVILILCLLTALVLTSSLRHIIAGPISNLAGVAQSVSRENDFSIRAAPSEEQDEVGVLVRSFNQMLGQIQERDRALGESRDRLERRVEERTSELQAANRELEAFSYSVAHDLRGPLDSIGNVMFLISQADLSKLDPHTRDMLAVLPASTRRMSRLIEDLLNLSRSKSAALHLQPLDLSRMAEETLRDLCFAEPNRQVDIDIQPGVFAIADQGLARVLLMNLLGNAWKYSAHTPHARISFGTINQTDECVFFVRDNGAGFDPRLKSRLFQAFQRLHAQSDFVGTGIGLATVSRIIERHGGRIWAEGEPNKGATFFFTLA